MKNYSPAGERDYENRRKMKTLKDKETDTIYYKVTYEDGCHTHDMTEEFKGYYSKDVKEAIIDFNKFFKTILKENSITGLNNNDRNIIWEIMQKYNIEPVNRDISPYKHIFYVHNKIFGDFDEC